MKDVSKSISNSLYENEKVLWAGKPQQGVIVRGEDVFPILFGMAFMGIPLFVLFKSFSTYSTLPSEFVFMPHVLIGFYFAIGRFFVEDCLRQKTQYAITSKRIIIVSGVLAQSVKSFDLKSLNNLALTESASNRGTITFGSQFANYSRGNFFWPGQHFGPRLKLIRDPKSVYEIICQARDLT